MSSYVIVNMDGRFLKTFDPDALEGRGLAAFTAKPEEALRYESVARALEAWNTQSTVKPFRPDGKPNKPLTAYTVEIIKL